MTWQTVFVLHMWCSSFYLILMVKPVASVDLTTMTSRLKMCVLWSCMPQVFIEPILDFAKFCDNLLQKILQIDPQKIALSYLDTRCQSRPLFGLLFTVFRVKNYTAWLIGSSYITLKFQYAQKFLPNAAVCSRQTCKFQKRVNCIAFNLVLFVFWKHERFLLGKKMFSPFIIP